MALITRMLRYTLAAACLCLASMAGDAAVYKCVDPSGRVTYSERPCDGGEEITVEAPCPSVEASAIDERLERAREYNEKVKQRLEPAPVRRILTHVGEPAEPPRISLARGPPAWDDPPVEAAPDWDALAQPQPEYVFDQEVQW